MKGFRSLLSHLKKLNTIPTAIHIEGRRVGISSIPVIKMKDGRITVVDEPNQNKTTNAVKPAIINLIEKGHTGATNPT